MTPSGNAYSVMFDAMLDIRLGEIFTAPRHQAAWAACCVRAAWGSSFSIAYWVEPKVNHLMTIESPPYPDSYSIMDARAFIFAHEYGHFFLDHLRRGFDRRVNIGDHDLAVFDPACLPSSASEITQQPHGWERSGDRLCGKSGARAEVRVQAVPTCRELAELSLHSAAIRTSPRSHHPLP
jgi:hypothetical protein